MRQLIQKKKKFDFDVEVIFKIYSDVTRLWSYPTLERIIDIYDDTVQHRLRELSYDLCTDDKVLDGRHPWTDLDSLSEETQKNLEELIEMKIRLQTTEFIDVLDVYNMFYVNRFEEHYNMPIKGVW